MNSLTDLNGYSVSLNVSYLDLRDPGYVLDPEIPADQTLEVFESATYSSPVGINLVEVIGADTAGWSATWTVDPTKVTSVTWGSLPAGVTSANPSSGVYTISGINSIADWNAVKSPTINPVLGYNGVYSYPVSITSSRNGTTTWTNTITVIEIPMIDYGTGFNFTDTVTQYIYNTPKILEDIGGSIQYTWKVTPSNTTFIDSIGSYWTGGGTRSFNNTTKVLTMTGTRTELNSMLSYLYFDATATATTNFSFTHYCKNETTLEEMTRTQTATYVDTDYWNIGGFTEQYHTHVGELITGPELTYAGSFTSVQVYPADLSSTAFIGVDNSLTIPNWSTTVSGGNNYVAGSDNRNYIACNLTSTGSVTVFYSATPPSSYFSQQVLSTGNSYISGMCFSAAGDRLLIGGGTNVRIYSRSGTTWSLEHTFTTPTDPHVDNSSLSSDGSYAILRGSVESRIYSRSGTTWTLQQTITQEFAGTGGEANVAITNDRAFLHKVLSTSPYSIVRVYSRSGTTWSLEQKITSVATGGSIAVNDANDSMIIAGGLEYPTRDNGYEYWTRSGTTWSLDSSYDAGGMLSATGNLIVGNQAPGFTDRRYFKKINGTWVKFETKSLSSWYGVSGGSLIADSTDTYAEHFKLDTGNTTIGLFSTNVTNLNAYTSWNNATKTLTITGTKAQVNSVLANLVFVSELNYTSDLLLNYQLNLTGSNVVTSQFVQHV